MVLLRALNQLLQIEHPDGFPPVWVASSLEPRRMEEEGVGGIFCTGVGDEKFKSGLGTSTGN